MCHVYCPLLFVFGCCDTAFVGHLSVDSATSISNNLIKCCYYILIIKPTRDTNFSILFLE